MITLKILFSAIPVILLYLYVIDIDRKETVNSRLTRIYLLERLEREGDLEFFVETARHFYFVATSERIHFFGTSEFENSIQCFKKPC